MLRPFSKPREVTIDLPPLLVESLGVGAEVLANYLTALADAAANEPDREKHPAPTPVLCRICELQFMPWFFEKHSELCLQEHWAEMDVQIAQENLNEHRNMIVKVLDTLEAQQSRPFTADNSTPTVIPQAEYKGLPIGPSPSPSGTASGTNSSSGTPPRSRDHSFSGGGNARPRSSFAVRRPLARVVELVLDLCDTALEINTPAIKEIRATDNKEAFRTLSPPSESRISQVLQWQSPSSNTLEQEQGLAALASDTEQVSRAKVNAVIRHRKIVEYAERIRVEYMVLVDECITHALAKAERIAAGQLTDSSSSPSPSEEDFEDVPEVPERTASSVQSGSLTQSEDKSRSQSRSRSQSQSTDSATLLSPPPQPLPPPPSESALTMTIRSSQNRARQGQLDSGKASPQTVSTASNSPMECPAPRAHRNMAGLLGSSQPSRRSLLLADSDTGEASDSSAPSSFVPGAMRTESPSSERSLESKRKSLVLTGMPSASPQPTRGSVPHSPLRMPKPRLSAGPESLPSPVTSPSTNASEMPHFYHMHHRRQSSAASSDAFRAPAPSSPHLSSVSQPHPRPSPPSIKDFEIIKPISKGAFGSVYLSKKKTTGEYFAIKVLKKADMIAKNQVANVKAERAIMMWQGESDFVAKLYWTFSSKDYLYLVMEYLNGGDCGSLVKVLGELPEDWTKKYIAEVVLGVQHLHSRGIVHRDLKPDNLLIDQTGHLKLTDFGLSRMGLVGRQKRMLKNHNPEPAPDFFRQGPFPRGTSISSSRSASVDYQGGYSYSPGSTPLMTPDVSSSLSQPTYFNLNHGNALSRQSSRRASDYRSDSGVSDGGPSGGTYRTFSLNEGSESPATLPLILSSGANEDEGQSEIAESPQLHPLHHTTSNQSGSIPTLNDMPPPQQQQPMQPPLMALFDPEDHSRRFVGTPDYLAPETINGVGQDEMSDWWSLGCIMFEFLFGYPPFNASTPDEVFDNILNRRINWPDDPEELVSKEAVDLMNRLIVINPQERIGANVNDKFANGGAEIRSHPWFSDISFDTLLEDKAQFVPNLENPEDTEYFDGRGATLQAFTEEMEDQQSTPPPPASTAGYPERPYDALSKVRSQGGGAAKRAIMPLHIPPHVRDGRSRRLSEPVGGDDFGNFTFKNLPVLEKANKDVIQKLRQEAMQQQRQSASSSPSSSSVAASSPTAHHHLLHHHYPSSVASSSSAAPPSLEASPLVPPQSGSKVPPNRSPSSSVSQGNSSPSRLSQPSSPLLVQFSTGNNLERRKTSGSSSTASSFQPSGSVQQPASNVDQVRLANAKLNSATQPSARTGRTIHSPEKPTPPLPPLGIPTARARSQTVGSQDGEQLSSSSQPSQPSQPSSLPRESLVPTHHKRRNQLLDVSPSSSDSEDPRAKALLKVQRRRQSSRRLSQINILEGPFFRPLDVLICEDHPVSRIVMERLFEKLHCRTITAVNGAEGVRYALGEVQFDIIMSEVKLPQLNGPDFARMVREARSVNRNTPIIAVTGYLKDLPEAHHFDALIEKPPTLSKLTEALCKFCQWKPPPKEYNSPPQVPSMQQQQPPPPQQLPHHPSSSSSSSSLRHVVPRVEGSPVSTSSSGFTHPPPSLYQGSSSRADSLGSSYFGDVDSIKAEGAPVVVGHQNEDWPVGLGVSDDATFSGSREHRRSKSATGTIPFPPLPRALSSSSEASNSPTPRKQRSNEAVRAKREGHEEGHHHHEYSESGDDEDDELGDVQVRARSPRSRSRRPGSKLGVEMMRTNSHGSVVCEEPIKEELGSPGEDISTTDDNNAPEDEETEEEQTQAHETSHQSIDTSSSASGLEKQFEHLQIPETTRGSQNPPSPGSQQVDTLEQPITPPAQITPTDNASRNTTKPVTSSSSCTDTGGDALRSVDLDCDVTPRAIPKNPNTSQ